MKKTLILMMPIDSSESEIQSSLEQKFQTMIQAKPKTKEECEALKKSLKDIIVELDQALKNAKEKMQQDLDAKKTSLLKDILDKQKTIKDLESDLKDLEAQIKDLESPTEKNKANKDIEFSVKKAKIEAKIDNLSDCDQEQVDLAACTAEAKALEQQIQEMQIDYEKQLESKNQELQKIEDECQKEQQNPLIQIIETLIDNGLELVKYGFAIKNVIEIGIREDISLEKSLSVINDNESRNLFSNEYFVTLDQYSRFQYTVVIINKAEESLDSYLEGVTKKFGIIMTNMRIEDNEEINPLIQIIEKLMEKGLKIQQIYPGPDGSLHFKIKKIDQSKEGTDLTPQDFQAMNNESAALFPEGYSVSFDVYDGTSVSFNFFENKNETYYYVGIKGPDGVNIYYFLPRARTKFGIY